MASTNQRKRNRWPEYILEALAIFKPPERLTVSEWADKYRMLDSKTSAQPGRWKTDKTPYLREIMDTLNDPEIEETILCCASQVGKTETLNNVLGYVIDQDPSPALIVYPTLELAEFASKNRIKAMIQASNVLIEKYNDLESKVLELQFDEMYIALSGANSPASLASRPVRFLLLDEIDKFPSYSGKEADPISLARERTKTFHNRKVFMCSTPTTEMGNIWQHFVKSDLQKKYHIPCPHCGHYQQLVFKQIKWPKEITDHNQVRDLAWYECEQCHRKIHDRDKQALLLAGEWRAENEPAGRVRRVGYQLNSIYSPWLTFGQIAAEFLKSKDFPELLMNFVNSWLGEPWIEKTNKTSADMVLEKQFANERGQVPEETLILTAGVDVQKDHFWYEIRAWGEKMTSWLIEYGRCETWDELQEILVRAYPSIWGESIFVSLACIDAGFRTDEVYEFCSYYPEICRPVKGSSKSLRGAPYTVSNIDKEGYGGLKLWIVDTSYFKDFIHGRMRKEVNDPGAWTVFKNCPREYAEHICAEQKVLVQDRRTGQVYEEWQKITSHAVNHLLDAAVYSAAAAEMAGIRYLQRPTETIMPTKERDEGGWIRRKNWLRR